MKITWMEWHLSWTLWSLNGYECCHQVSFGQLVVTVEVGVTDWMTASQTFIKIPSCSWQVWCHDVSVCQSEPLQIELAASFCEFLQKVIKPVQVLIETKFKKCIHDKTCKITTRLNVKTNFSSVKSVTSWKEATWKGLFLKTTAYPGDFFSFFFFSFLFFFFFFFFVLEMTQSGWIKLDKEDMTYQNVLS